jgi:hypothetical protein
MQTIEQFLKTNPIEMTLFRVPENPVMENSQEMINYHVSLKLGSRIMTTFFSTGTGWVEAVPRGERGFAGFGIKETEINKILHAVRYDPKRNEFLPYAGRSMTVHEFEIANKVLRIKAPTVSDVLDCLAMDASFADESFDDWCDMLGYAKDLAYLLGRVQYDSLLLDTERL